MKRILIRSHGPDPKGVKSAFEVAMRSANEAQANIIHLVVPAKSSFSPSVIADFLGDDASNKLLKGAMVPIKNGPRLKLDSVTTIRRSTDAVVVIAAFLGGKDLREVDMLPNAKAIVFLPWISEEGEGWQESWNAEVHGEVRKESVLNLHSDLEAELQALTSSINLSTGFTHPSDEKSAKRMFKTLKEKAIPFEAKKIRSWALRNGWRPDFAEDLYELAEKMAADK
jgi:hypothetical protein